MRQIININKDWYFTKEIAFPQKINNLNALKQLYLKKFFG